MKVIRTGAFLVVAIAGILVILAVAIIHHERNHSRLSAVTPESIGMTAASPSTQLTDEEKIATLQAHAKARKMYWYVFCVPKADNTPKHYEAVARENGDPRAAIYIEDGARPVYFGVGLTPVSAAWDLVANLDKGEPEIIPSHRPAHESDCRYQDVIDSEHPKGIPCKHE